MEAITEHLRHCVARNLRPGTIEQRRRALQRARRAGIDLLGASAVDLRAHLERPTQGPDARAAEISHLRGFYRWAVDEGLIDVDPMARVPRPKLHVRLPRPMPENDLAMAIELAPDRLRPMLLLGAYGGLRCCEIAPLRAEHLLFDRSPPVVWIMEGKGGDSHPQPFPTWAALEVRTLLPRSGWCFPRQDGAAGPVPAHRVSQLGNRYLHSLGISHTMHALRHFYGTHVHRVTRDLRKTQELLRHKSSRSSEIYTWVDPEGLGEAVESLPRFGSQRRLRFA